MPKSGRTIARPSSRPRPRRRRADSVAADVVARLTARIRSGRLRPGEELPAERELSTELGVSRASLREAVRALASMGVLTTRHGSGTRVADGGDLLRSPFEFLMLFAAPSLEDLCECRELIEVHLVGRAAERRSEEELAAIRAAVEEMEATTDRPDEITAANLRFHAAIARAARLPLLERVWSCLHDAIHASMVASRPAVRDWTSSLAVHRAVCEAIARRDPAAARRAMATHMAMMVENLRKAGAMRG